LAYINQFTRNRCTSVSEPSQDTLRACCRLQDSLTEAEVEILVKLPDLNIIEARGDFSRSPYEDQHEPNPLLKKIIGVRVGPGMLKILKGLIGTKPDKEELCYMVEECCEAVILSMTKGILARAPRDPEDGAAFFSKMVRKNIRLYNQCAAFRKDSPLVEGMDVPDK
jgi:hypothetical protein